MAVQSMQEIRSRLLGADNWPLSTLQTKEGNVLTLAQQPHDQERGLPQVDGRGPPGISPRAAGRGAACARMWRLLASCRLCL